MRTKRYSPFRLILAVACVLLASCPVFAAQTIVSNSTQLATALLTVQAGDEIVWKNGTYTNLGTLTFESTNNWGTEAAPITLRAETSGGVIFRGNTQIQMGGHYQVLKGFRFDNTGFPFSGSTTPSWVIQTRGHDSVDRHAYNCRVTECAIVNYDNPLSPDSSKWLEWYGATNRFDHNFVSGKRSQGALFIVELSTSAIEAHHTIDNNVFADRTPDPAGGNEFETLRLGTSSFSDQNAHITVESNYFYRCSGEAEFVSNKSCENTYRYNMFVECAGSLCLRHGRGCLVEGNVFLGNNVLNSGGIRVVNQDHVVVNNYLQDLAGSDYQAALAIMDGTAWVTSNVSPDLSGSYVQVKNVTIAHNTIINAADPVNYGVGYGGSGRGSAPRDSTLAANIIVSTNAPLFTITHTPINITNLNNIVWGAATGLSADPELVVTNPLLLAADANGISRPDTNSPAIGAAGTEVLLSGRDMLDMDGALRPLTGRDIGADQVGLGTRPPAPVAITEAGPVWIQSSDPAAITVNPQGRTNVVGSTVMLSVTATGSLPILYQWRIGGTNLSNTGNIEGADSWALVLTNAQVANSGSYDVIARNAYGVTTSTVAAVSVYVVYYPPSITNQPTSRTAPTGSNATFTVGASGTAPLAYQWYFNTNTLLSGQTGASLTLSNVQSNDAGSYTVIVTNLYGSATSAVATLTVIPPDMPPSITSSPVNRTITESQNATFTVTAAGTAPLSYQWMYTTTNILANGTSSSFTVTNAQVTDAGAYHVIVTNAFGAATSSVAVLTVNASTPASAYYWDATSGTTGIQDGAGTWTNFNWLLNGSGSDVVWDNVSGPNDAVFGGGLSGTAGSVTIPASTNINVKNITFNAPFAGSYTIAAKTAATSVLNLFGTPAITVTSGVSATISTIIAGTGFTKEGAGTLTLAGSSGATNIYSGLVTVNGGTLILLKGSDGIECITAGGVAVNSGATLRIPKKDSINDAATVTCSTGGVVEFVSAGGDAFASLVLDGGAVTNSDTGTTRYLTVTAAVDARSGRISGNAVKTLVLGGAAGLTKTTAGTLIMGPSVANTYSGLTTIVEGRLIIASSNAIPSGSGKGNVTVDGVLDLNGFGTGINGLNGAATGVISNGSATAATFTIGNNSSTGTYSGSINGAIAVTKTSAGVQILGGTNTYSGNTTISSGRLIVNSSNAIPSGAGCGDLTVNATLVLNGVSMGVNGLTGSGTISNGLTSAVTLTIGNNSSAGTYSGKIANGQGTVSVIKTGSGIETLTGGNTYSGNTMINAGTLALSGSGSIANSTNITIAGGATFDVSALTTPLTNNQTLTASGTTSAGVIATASNTGLTFGVTSALRFSAFNGITAPLTITGAGTVALNTGNVVTVTAANGGTPLGTNVYKLISKGSSGGVIGVAPSSVTVNGDGIVNGTIASLVISDGELFLRISISEALTVNGGSGGGSYASGARVPITAAAPASGKVFDQWTGDTQYVDSVSSASTTVTMPEQAVVLTATYKDITYALTVGSGSGGGSYTNGAQVPITAAAPASGKVFDQWTGDTQYVDSVSSASTTVTMPAQAVVLTATYKDAAVYYLLTTSVETNGAVSPASTNVLAGDSAIFVITASNYYRIATLTTNGTAVAGMTFDNGSTTTNFVWSNVQTDGVLVATFTAQVTTAAPADVPYEWLASYGLTNSGVTFDQAAAADQDSDGLAAWQEYIAGTDPTNTTSCFTAAQATRNTISWSPVSGRVYSVYWSTNLMNGFQPLETNIFYPQGSYTNTAPDSRVNHYQIKVRLK